MWRTRAPASHATGASTATTGPANLVLLDACQNLFIVSGRIRAQPGRKYCSWPVFWRCERG
uniref:Uncharacterized protein n=1 Tax=Peronospora matthiolae TaxID=2874970 RepID=A0AAV1VBR6_9STRA